MASEPSRQVRLARPPASEVRDRIRDHLAKNPGASITEVLNGLGMEWGTIHHHLRILERAGLIRSVFEGRTHRYFPATTKSHEMHSLALLRRARVLTLVRRVVAVPGERQQELLTVIGLSRKVFRSYADRLVALGLLREVRAGRERRYFPTRALERLVNPDQHEPPAADPSSQ